MSSSIVDSKGIIVQDFSCHIEKIEFSYTNDKHEEKKGVLYDTQNRRQSVKENTSAQSEKGEGKGMLIGRVSNDKDYEYFFITNYKGKKLKLLCNRQVNQCQDEKHLQFDYDYRDIKTKDLKSEEKLITDGNITLYYYDIFTRTTEYTKAGAKTGAQNGYEAGKYICSNEDSDGAMGGIIGGASGGYIGALGGAVLGHSVDLLCSLRFIHLPRISSVDDKWMAMLTYNECPHRPSVPTIIFYTYPDIQFNLDIGILGLSKSHVFKSTKEEDEKKKRDKTERMPFSCKFTVSYANVTKNISFDKKIEEKDLEDDEQKEGSKFANAIKTLKDFLEMAVRFSQTLKELIMNAKAGNETALTNQLTGGLYKPGGRDWFRGSLNIQPQLSAKWKYSVSDDLTKIGRNINLNLGIGCTGTLTIDVVEVASMMMDKSKKAVKVTALASSIASGGLAALPAALLTFLCDYVVDWLKSKVKKGLICDVMLIGNVSLNAVSLTWDTTKDDIFEGKALNAEIKPEIMIIVGADYKVPVTLFCFVKAEAEAKAVAEAAAALKWIMTLNVKDGWLGIDHDMRIPPITLKVECYVVGSYEVSVPFGDNTVASKHKKEFGEFTHEWKTNEYKYDIERHKWFKVVDTAAGSGSAGGASRNW